MDFRPFIQDIEKEFKDHKATIILDQVSMPHMLPHVYIVRWQKPGAYINRDEVAGIFGDEWYTYSDIGIGPHVRCIMHWVGLKMAHKQLYGT